MLHEHMMVTQLHRDCRVITIGNNSRAHHGYAVKRGDHMAWSAPMRVPRNLQKASFGVGLDPCTSLHSGSKASLASSGSCGWLTSERLGEKGCWVANHGGRLNVQESLRMYQCSTPSRSTYLTFIEFKPATFTTPRSENCLCVCC